MKRGYNFILKYLIYILIFILIFFIIFFLPQTKSYSGSGTGPFNCSSCDDCSAAIGNASSGATVFLNTTLTGIVNTCINFGNRNNITFDCQNNSITGDGTGGSTGKFGVNLTSVVNNTVRNCVINSFPTGVWLSNSNNTLLTNLTLYEIYYGVYASFSYYNNLTNIIANNNSIEGLAILYSNGNNLTNIVTNNNTNHGIDFEIANNSILTNITSINNGGSGMYINIAYYNTLTGIIASNNSQDGILIASSNNNTFMNIVANNNSRSSMYGILLQYSAYDTLINITTNNNSYGLYLSSSNYSSIANISTNNNKIGVTLDTSHNNLLTNITANNNSNANIYLISSLNNSLTNAVSFNSQLGIQITNSAVNNTLVNIIANNNVYGLYIGTNSKNNTIINISTNNNSKYGIDFLNGASYNTIKNSFIQFNSLYGIVFNFSGSAPQYNLFYNNYFNNSVQYLNATAVINYFNTTKTAGTNIVGGTYIGGNYWAAPNGSGFSQTCTSSTDGICDTAYSLDGINYDYLPLTCIESWSCGDWQTCQPSGTQTRTCTDANYCQTYKYQPLISQPCTYSGGGLPDQNSTDINTGAITSGQPSTVSITNPNINIFNITLNTNKNISNAKITVSKTGIGNFLIGLPFGVFYRAFYINTTLSNENLNNVTMEFRVETSWLKQENRSYNDIVLYRIPNSSSSWQSLTTISIRNDSQYYYFSSLSPGFSTFVILAGEPGTVKCTLLQKRCFNNEIQSCDNNGNWTTVQLCPNECENAQCVQTFLGIKVSLIYYGGIIIIGFIIILILFFMFRKFKKNYR